MTLWNLCLILSVVNPLVIQENRLKELLYKVRYTLLQMFLKQDPFYDYRITKGIFYLIF